MKTDCKICKNKPKNGMRCMFCGAKPIRTKADDRRDFLFSILEKMRKYNQKTSGSPSMDIELREMFGINIDHTFKCVCCKRDFTAHPIKYLKDSIQTRTFNKNGDVIIHCPYCMITYWHTADNGYCPYVAGEGLRKPNLPERANPKQLGELKKICSPYKKCSYQGKPGYEYISYPYINEQTGFIEVAIREIEKPGTWKIINAKETVA